MNNLTIVLLSLLLVGCSSTRHLAEKETALAVARLNKTALPDTIRTEALEGLPPPLQRYLLKAGVIGQRRTQMFQARFEGRMKLGGETDKWRRVEGFQSNVIDSRCTRLFYIKTRMFGLMPVVGRDKYDEGRGNMLIRVMDKFTVVNGQGATMNTAALVTILNDMMFFPSAMLSPGVRWETHSDSSARATLTDCGVTVTGVFFFNKDNDVVNFMTDDRTYDNGRGDVRKARWWTPMRRHATVHGIRIPVEGGAEWDFGDRRFFYADFKFHDIRYNPYNTVP